MKLCVVSRAPGPRCPASAIARGLADLGHEVHLLLAPAAGRDAGAAADLPDPGRAIAHHLPAPRAGWLRRLVAARGRRRAIARVLRSIAPEVVHLADPADRAIAVPPDAVVVLGPAAGPAPPGADAVLLPDGRLLDRAGFRVPAPGAPPPPAAGQVVDGLDPLASSAHWRLLTYLASVDHLRRSRRVRLDGPRPSALPTPRLASRRGRLPTGAG